MTGREDGALANEFTRISPQLNVRYDDVLDIQYAYIMGEEKNRTFKEPNGDIPTWKFTGHALEAGYMPVDFLHLGVHYDYYQFDDKSREYHRIVPAVTYILNESIRGTLYYEQNLSTGSETKVNKIYLNMRTMF